MSENNEFDLLQERTPRLQRLLAHADWEAEIREAADALVDRFAPSPAPLPPDASEQAKRMQRIEYGTTVSHVRSLIRHAMGG